MHLHQLTISGFRSFGEERTIVFDDVTAFIGSNNTGKTAALAALAKLFSQRRSDRQIVLSDFHIPYELEEDVPTRRVIKIEAMFHFDELGTGVKNESIPVFFSGMTIDAPESVPMLRIRLEATWEKSANPEGTIETHAYYVTSTSEGGEDNLVPAPRSALDSIRMVYVPAARDPQIELRVATGSVMGTLLGSVKWDEAHKSKTEELLDSISKTVLEQPGAGSVGKSIKKAWREYDYDKRFHSANLSFIGTDFESVVKSPSISFSPAYGSRDCKVDELGDGLRSLFHLSMIEGLISLEEDIRERKNKLDEQFDFELPVLTILAIEEPENHIAPHLLGSLMDRIGDMGNKPNCQAVVTSHSASIIKRVEPKSIRHFSLDINTGITKCCGLTLPKETDEEYKYLKGSLLAYPEVLFARAVVLGEGASEEVVLPKLIQLRLGAGDVLGISVAPLGGRHVNHFWRLLSNLGIPYVTLLDLDCERKGGGAERINYVVEQLSKVDKNVSEDFNMLQLTEKLNELERWGVFFSEPLDLDFSMLESFPSAYKDVADGGPQLNDGTPVKDVEVSELNPDARRLYEERIDRAIAAVLHSGGGHEGEDGHSYNTEQRALMPWYQYLFLGKRGKPAIHFQVLTQIDDTTLKNGAPASLVKLVDCLGKLIEHSVPLLEKEE